MRACLTVDDDVPVRTEDQIRTVTPLVTPYVLAYAGYLVNAASGRAPEPNDWGDLEAFIYVQDSRRVLTSDKRWLQIANDVGLSGHIMAPAVL